jgi:histidine triad (HIT) family protein
VGSFLCKRRERTRSDHANTLLGEAESDVSATLRARSDRAQRRKRANVSVVLLPFFCDTFHMETQQTTDFYCDFVLNGKLEVTRLRETETVLAFMHTKPSWTFHCVIIPKHHVRRLVDVDSMEVVKEIFEVAQSIILEQNLHETNYKIITNGGSFQDSQHLHFHLVSGINMSKIPSAIHE